MKETNSLQQGFYMGGLAGHASLGLFFLFIGLWHLYNHTKLVFIRPYSNKPVPIWFPAPRLRHLELYLIMLACCIFIFTQLWKSPFSHDGSILSTHLPHLEHTAMAIGFFIYASFSTLLVRTRSWAQDEVSYLLCASAFAQQLLLIHFHSTDHVGIEGQYHTLLQLVVSVTLATTLMGINRSSSLKRFGFILGYVRSLSVVFQGVWLVVMGLALWTQEFIAKGCFIHEDNRRVVVQCRDAEAMGRAKALAVLEFSWVLMGVMVFGTCFYLGIERIHSRKEDTYEQKEREELIELHMEKESGSGGEVEV